MAAGAILLLAKQSLLYRAPDVGKEKREQCQDCKIEPRPISIPTLVLMIFLIMHFYICSYTRTTVGPQDLIAMCSPCLLSKIPSATRQAYSSSSLPCVSIQSPPPPPPFRLPHLMQLPASSPHCLLLPPNRLDEEPPIYNQRANHAS